MADQEQPPQKRQEKSKDDKKTTPSETLPNDILSEILTRIPSNRHVIRCGTVCKRWLSVISDQLFGESYSATAQTLLLLQKQRYRRDSWSSFDSELTWLGRPDGEASVDGLGFLPFSGFTVRASRHDLLLLSTPSTNRFPPTNDDNLLRFYVANPLTKTWLAVPPLPPRGILRLLRCGVTCPRGGSGYEVAVFCETTSLGFDWENMVDRDRVYVTVFSSEAGRWGPLSEVPPPSEGNNWMSIGTDSSNFNHTAPAGGRMYWLEGASMVGRVGVVSIDPVAVAAGKRCCRLISLPNETLLSHIVLGAYKDRLRLAAMIEEKKICILRVWELNVDNSVDNNSEDSLSDENCCYCDSCGGSFYWSLVYDLSINLKRNVCYDDEVVYSHCRVMAFHPSNPNIVFLLQCNRRIFEYDMSRNKGRYLGQGGCGGGKVSAHVVCVPSLWPTKLPSDQL